MTCPGEKDAGIVNESVYIPELSESTKFEYAGGSPTWMETLASATGLFWESRTFPEIMTVSP